MYNCGKRVTNVVLRGMICALVAIIAGGSAQASPSAMRSVAIPMPATNLPGGPPIADDSQVVYVLDDPPTHAPDPANGPYFKNFVPRFFLVKLHNTATHIAASKPRLLFTGSRGMGIGLGSMLGGWLIYEEYTAWYNPGGPWRMLARNLLSGKQIVLDSRDREDMPSVTLPASSDGRTAVWQTFTVIGGRPTSIIRAYDFHTGRRRVLAQGGTPSKWEFGSPSVSGRSVIFERRTFATQQSQILLKDLRSGRIRTLTPPAGANTEPTISGSIAVWKQGWGAGRAITVLNLLTGVRKIVNAPGVDFPQATAGRYVVFGELTGVVRDQIYDARTGREDTLFAPHDGFATGGVTSAGGHTALYDIGRACGSPIFLCPGKLIVVALP